MVTEFLVRVVNQTNVIGATFSYGLPGEAYATDGIVDKATNKDWAISMLMADQDNIKATLAPVFRKCEGKRETGAHHEGKSPRLRVNQQESEHTIKCTKFGCRIALNWYTSC